MITVNVMHGKEALAVDVRSAGTVEDLKKAIETITGVFVRKQKLIHKGTSPDVPGTADEAARLRATRSCSCTSQARSCARMRRWRLCFPLAPKSCCWQRQQELLLPACAAPPAPLRCTLRHGAPPRRAR